MHLNWNIDICSLLVRIDCVAMKPEWKLYFLEWKTRSSVLNLVPGTLEIAFQNFVIPKWAEHNCRAPTPPSHPRKKGTNSPLLIQSVVTLFKSMDQAGETLTKFARIQYKEYAMWIVFLVIQFSNSLITKKITKKIQKKLMFNECLEIRWKTGHFLHP